jgi:2'-5' RNA ligase
MRKRVFIAINPSSEVRQRLWSLSQQWPELPCRWIKKENLHLTLAFLGYLNEQQLQEVIEITEEVSKKIKPFDVHLNKVCYGPPKTMPPRLVWIEGKRLDRLSKIKQELDSLLSQKIGFVPEKRELLPHITLGRIKRFEWRRIEPEERPEINLKLDIDFPVRSLDVMESILKRQGAEYQVISSHKLYE